MEEPPPTRPDPKPVDLPEPESESSAGLWTSIVVFVLLATAFLVFVAQNTDHVDVEWTVWSVGVSLAAVVFGAMLLGSVLTLAGVALWRLRRHRRRRERRRLRGRR